MQKIKLLLLLTLLCVGVSESWAAKTYQVKYEGLPSGKSGSFSINNTYVATTYTFDDYFNTYYVYERYTKNNNSSSLTQTLGYSRYNNVSSVSNNNFQAFSNDDNDNVITTLTTSNITTYITPGSVEDYNVSLITVDNTATGNYVGTITISYALDPRKDPRYVSWSEGNFTYSTYHIQSTNKTGDGSGMQGFMDDTFDYYPEQPEIAISLNLDQTVPMEDVACVTVDYYLGNDGYVHEIPNRPTVPQVNGTNLPTTEGTSTTINGVKYTYLGDNYDRHGTGYWGPSGEYYNGYKVYQRFYFYSRSFKGKRSEATSVVIPKEVTHDGVTYKVTAIQKWGFCYEQNDMTIRPVCSTYAQFTDAQGRTVMTYTDKPGEQEKDNINSHRNDYLKTVTFEQYSNIHSVGDYAFMSCKALESVQIPASVTYFGQGIFECCTALTDCRFQTLTAPMITYYNDLETSASTTDGTVIPLTAAMVDRVRWSVVRNYTFWFCTALESLELPDGITEIKGLAKGASMQYMTSLKNVRLPNTLTTIGPHFLCCAMSLETLTIPASVKTIDGACFHGCESLKSVYLLGEASALKTTTGSTGENTFGENTIYCADHVSDATFYCAEKYLSSYQNDDGWKLIDEHGIYDASAPTYGNTLTTIPIEKRVFPARWVTAIFPYQVDDYKSVFGANTRVAVMDPEAEHTVTTGKEQATGKQVRMYNIVFKLIPEDQSYIPAGTPVMICAGQQTEYALYSADQQVTEWFRLESTKEHGTPVTATDGAVITMKGKYVPYTMHPWDFYFMYKATSRDEDGNVTEKDYDNPAKFYRVPDAENAATVGICRCYWTISMDGVKIDPTMTTAKEFFFDDEVDGIENVETRINIAGIYDLQGRKLNIDESELPQGLYIVNGKKLIKK